MPVSPSANKRAGPAVRLMQMLMTSPSINPIGPAAAPTKGITETVLTMPISPSISESWRPSINNATSIRSVPRSIILLYRRFLPLLAQCQNLAGVRGDYLVLGVGGDYFDGDMLEAGKKDPLPHIAFEQQIFFLIGEVKGLLQVVDGRRRLLEQNLDGRVGYHREPVGRPEKVVDVLRNSRQS